MAGTYRGGCQCGAVRFSVEVDTSQAIACNCSRCGRGGFVLAFAPADRFTLLSGEDAQAEYRFNTHNIAHLFCRICGIQSFGRGAAPDGTETIAVNVRCLDGIDVHALEPQKVDGRSF